MKNSIISLLITLVCAIMIFPMIMIPLMGIAIVIWGLYIFLHDIIWNALIHPHKGPQEK